MTKKLTVRLFGAFAAQYGDTVLTLGKHTDSKFGKLFQILMTRPGENFSKRAIIDRIYELGEVEDPNASFNNTMFRLRKYLEKSPLPPGKYLVIEDGAVRFDGPVEVESDAWSFEQTADAFDAETDEDRKLELSKNACRLYQGDYLPRLSNEMWVIEKNQYFQKKYFRMLRYLLKHLEKEGDYAGIGLFSQRAIEIEPVGEWLAWHIDSLVAQGRLLDASKAYQAAVERMEAMGDSAPKGTLEQLQEIGKRIQAPGSVREWVSMHLQEEKPPQGAYYCSMPGFVEQYRILKRVERRQAIPFVLLLCTIQSAEGHPVDSQKKSEKQGKKLQEAFRTNLRAGDVYVKYNANQYLLLCVGAEAENVPEIATRIDVDFRRRCYGHYMIHYRLLENVSVL